MFAWQLEQKGQDLVRIEREDATLPEGWSRVAIAGCGLCHTDLGFIYTDVKTRHPLPLCLGHEISGTVVEGDHKGQQVIVPAVIPCGQCAACEQGLPRICSKQMMPGNDIQGGFAQFIDVPSHELVALPNPVDQETLARMSVIADAVTTPLQAIHNVGLEAGQLAIIIGCGGVGSFGALLAKAYGAHVIAIDIDQSKLEKIQQAGADHTLNVRDQNAYDTKKQVKALVKSEGYPRFGHRIFETSGTTPGQELAFNLLGFGAQMAVVGFTMDKLNVRLSNLMAFDARVVGNWGASPSVYPEAIAWADKGALQLDSFTELFPMSDINDVIKKVHHEGASRRPVLVPS